MKKVLDLRATVGRKVLVPVALGISTLAASAQTTPVEDLEGVVTTATTVFGAVAALTVTIITFYVIARMIKRTGK